MQTTCGRWADVEREVFRSRCKHEVAVRRKIEKSHYIIFSVTNVGGIMEPRSAVISLAFFSHLPCEIPKYAVRAT